MPIYLTCNAILQENGIYRAMPEGQGILTGSLDDIFNALSKNGWELVNCFPSSWNPTHTDAGPGFDILAITAIFRRGR